MIRGAIGAAAPAPARTHVRAGALLFGRRPRSWPTRLAAAWTTTLMAFGAAACDRVPGSGPQEIELEGGRVVQLPEGSALLDVELTARGRSAAFQPAQLSARPGDVVRFRATEMGTHALVFAADSLNREQRDFLERTNQMRAPPLIEEGSTWIVSLDGAPPGVYPFRCITHGVHGRLTVSPDGS